MVHLLVTNLRLGIHMVMVNWYALTTVSTAITVISESQTLPFSIERRMP